MTPSFESGERCGAQNGQVVVMGLTSEHRAMRFKTSWPDDEMVPDSVPIEGVGKVAPSTMTWTVKVTFEDPLALGVELTIVGITWVREKMLFSALT
jgi:hypothetical protein